jgi:hypothetical protein
MASKATGFAGRDWKLIDLPPLNLTFFGLSASALLPDNDK